MLDGRTVKSCSVLAADVDGQEVTTIEALARAPPISTRSSRRSSQHQGLQCGFCTPGMVISTLQLLRDNPDPTEDEVRHGIAGNLCRCTGYQLIVESVLDGGAHDARSGASATRITNRHAGHRAANVSRTAGAGLGEADGLRRPRSDAARASSGSSRSMPRRAGSRSSRPVPSITGTYEGTVKVVEKAADRQLSAARRSEGNARLGARATRDFELREEADGTRVSSTMTFQTGGDAQRRRPALHGGDREEHGAAVLQGVRARAEAAPSKGAAAGQRDEEDG